MPLHYILTGLLAFAVTMFLFVRVIEGITDPPTPLRTRVLVGLINATIFTCLTLAMVLVIVYPGVIMQGMANLRGIFSR